MKVVKFGGTSLATGAAVKQALNIITLTQLVKSLWFRLLVNDTTAISR